MRRTRSRTQRSSARRYGVLSAAAALLTLSAVLPAGAAPTAEPRAARTAAASDAPDPIDFAVVVDQSKSLADNDLSLEVEAASLLTQGEISERSRAAVIGFGSSEKDGQSPVREVCGLTTVDAAGLQRLSDCAKELNHRDSRRMGPGTDFPAALRQAVDRLTEDDQKSTPKVVFLLTDGKLDVRDSPEYGTDPDSRQANGAKQLAEELARARRESVQVWPLGFGGDIDRKALAAMAAGGYRNGCADVPGATPRMRVVGTAAEIDKALQETFAAARCARVAQGTVEQAPADLYVNIPPIATDGSITVSKHDPKVSVTYYDPRGRKVLPHGEANGSRFELSGQDGPVEALRVQNPVPGRWRVHVTAPEGHRDKEVAVRAIWQGRLRSVVTLDPAAPRAGERAVVEVRLQTRDGVVITDPGQLGGLKVSARMSGSGFDPVVVPLRDDGGKPDAKAGDVRYAGEFKVPEKASGALKLITEMTAPGVTSDHRPLYARIAIGQPKITAGLSIDQATANPGSSVSGSLNITNDDSVPHALKLELADQPPGADLRISPATVRIASGKRDQVSFTVTLGDRLPLGDLAGKITVTDTGDGTVLNDAFLNIRIESPPTWWDRLWWTVIGGAALALLLATFLAIRLREQGRRRDLRGVRIELLGPGSRADELTVQNGQSARGEFHFTVDGTGGPVPVLRRSRSGAAGAYRLKRKESGEFMLRPDRERERLLKSGEPASLDGGFALLVHDSGGRDPSLGRRDTGQRAGEGTRPGWGRRGPTGRRTGRATAEGSQRRPPRNPDDKSNF